LNILDFFDLILTQNNHKTILREVLWAISNICAGSINQCMQVLESPVFEKVLEYLGDQDYKIKKEAVLIINYYSSSNCLNMILKLLNRGILEKLCIILENDKEKSILLSCLIIIFDFMATGEQLEEYESENRITKLFQRCGGVNIVETLQMHTDLEIHKISLAILDRFYETNEISI
jgi:importin subunit alpha-1